MGPARKRGNGIMANGSGGLNERNFIEKSVKRTFSFNFIDYSFRFLCKIIISFAFALKLIHNRRFSPLS